MLFAWYCLCLDCYISSFLNVLCVLNIEMKRKKKGKRVKLQICICAFHTICRALKFNYLCRKWCTTIIGHLGHYLPFRAAPGVAKPLWKSGESWTGTNNWIWVTFTEKVFKQALLMKGNICAHFTCTQILTHTHAMYVCIYIFFFYKLCTSSYSQKWVTN